MMQSPRSVSYRDQYLTRHNLERPISSQNATQKSILKRHSSEKTSPHRLRVKKGPDARPAKGSTNLDYYEEPMIHRHSVDESIVHSTFYEYDSDSTKEMQKVEQGIPGPGHEQGDLTSSNEQLEKHSPSPDSNLDTLPTNDELVQMINNLAKDLDLSEIERQCLRVSDKDEQKIKLNRRSKSSPQAKAEPVADKKPDDYLSTWSSLIDSISFKNWLPVVDWNNNSVETESLSDRTHHAAGKRKTHEDYFESIFSLIDNICPGNHSGEDSPGNCFKCQYKDSFKSFTLKYIEDLDQIWKSSGLSPQEKEEALREQMEMWISQLTEQNLNLAIDCHESVEASDKLKSVLLQSKNSMRALQKQQDKDKASITALTYEISMRDKTIQKSKSELEILSEKIKALEGSLQDSQLDVQSLIELIIRLRDTGKWDVNGLPLSDATFNRIFTGNYYLHGAKVYNQRDYSAMRREWRLEVENLKSEADTLRAIITAKDKEIQRCKSSEPGSGRCKNVK